MNDGKSFFDEKPLLFMPTLATVIGLHETIVLNQIHYWLKLNEKAKKNYKDGFYWTYNSYEEWQKQFPFWSISTIKRLFISLEKMNLIIVSNYNKLKIDRTKWYRIDYDVLESFRTSPLCQNDTMDSVKMIRPLPETNTENIRKPKFKHVRKKKDGSLTDYHLQATAELAKSRCRKVK